jgi:hypothetical protein
MAVFKNEYSLAQKIGPYYLKGKRYVNAQNDIEGIIIDDWTPNLTSSISTTVIRPVIWLKMESDYRVTVLANAPQNPTPIGTHPFAASQMFLKGGELFVVDYADSNLDEAQRNNVTGYQFGSQDALYVKIEYSDGNDLLTIYSL